MRRVALAAVCVLACQGATVAADPTTAAHIHIAGVVPRAAVEQALDGAARRLERSECRQILDDFTDVTGAPLRRNLIALGIPAEEYLMHWMVFVDGQGEPVCREHRAPAFTLRGGRVVWVCGGVFAAKFPFMAEGDIILIHEMLHSLGLGENPPASIEITRQVEKRCGR